MYPAVDLIASSTVLLDAAVVGEEHASNASAPDCGALERRDFACESRLITDTRRQESQQARHFGAPPARSGIRCPIRSSTFWRRSSRKYSATVSAVSGMRQRARQVARSSGRTRGPCARARRTRKDVPTPAAPKHRGLATQRERPFNRSSAPRGRPPCRSSDRRIPN